jgi:hypothetical protein
MTPPAAAQIVEQATPPDKATTKIKKSKKLPEGMTSSTQAPAASEAKTAKHAPAPVRNASPAEIQSAKSEGKVWVNTDSGVYHKGGKWFGATKQGKFMTEQEATRAGYRAAKNEK